MRGRLSLAGLALLALTVCDARAKSSYLGPMLHVTKAIELDKADMVRVEMRMGAGLLNIEGGSPRLLDADFAFSAPEQEPVVRYDSGSFRGRLTIAEPSRHFESSGRYERKLRLNDEVPLEVVTHLGAGNAEMKLGSLNLRGVEVHMGVGNLDMDLRGNPKRDYDVAIHGGVGNATVRLPAGVGIVADAQGGIGNIDAEGLEKHNGRWVSAQHENSKVTLHLDIRGGIGNITLRAN
jgi:hypothetical protein